MQQRAFTLIEILIVIVLVAVLAGVVVPQYAESDTQTKAASAADLSRNLNKAVSYYRFRNGDDDWLSLKAMDEDEAVEALNQAGCIDQEKATPPAGYSLAWADGWFAVTED